MELVLNGLQSEVCFICIIDVIVQSQKLTVWALWIGEAKGSTFMSVPVIAEGDI
jgi:hypothetical protein